MCFSAIVEITFPWRSYSVSVRAFCSSCRAMLRARSAGSCCGFCAAAAAADNATAQIAAAIVRSFDDTVASSAVLRTERNEPAVGERDLADQTGTRSVAGTAGFHLDRLLHRRLEVLLANITLPEESGRGSLERPGFHLALLVLHINEQIDVRIPPIDLAERAGGGEPLAEIKQGRHVVVRQGRAGEEAGKTNRESKPANHVAPPWLPP